MNRHRLNNSIDFNCTNVGVKSCNFQNINGTIEESGTSFSSPAVANIVVNIKQKYFILTRKSFHVVIQRLSWSSSLFFIFVSKNEITWLLFSIP